MNCCLCAVLNILPQRAFPHSRKVQLACRSDKFNKVLFYFAVYTSKQVDGILFYHNGAPYVPGQTPLVGWLKPFMLYERFRLNVPEEYMAYRPDNYKDLEQWVSIVSHAHQKDLQKGRKVAPKQEVMESSNDYGYLDASAEVMEETEDSLDSSLSN